jgi:hypothetical protein
MAEPKAFASVKLVCGIISSCDPAFQAAEDSLVERYGTIEIVSPLFDFNLTDYYEKQMGRCLKRKFVSFLTLIDPARLSQIKLETNALEEEIRKRSGASFRLVNLDPGYLTASALIMATAKDFSHRVPLQNGIYAHLELLFTKAGAKTLDWTYPDFRRRDYQDFFVAARGLYLGQMKKVS